MSEEKKKYLAEIDPETHEEKQANGKPKPITDLSRRVVRLARYLDRLGLDAKYTIVLRKGTTQEERWVISVEKTEEMRTMEL